MRTSVVIGCLVAVVCFVAVESRALSSLEVNANQANPTETAQQVSFQGQSDEVKQDKDKKGIRSSPARNLEYDVNLEDDVSLKYDYV